MRALRMSEFGAPAKVLHLVELPTPKPGAGEIRIRLSHRPINPSDLLAVAGVYPTRPTLPGTPGLEGVGRVDAIGSEAIGLQHGQRVITLAGLPGTWAEQMIVPADRVLPVPDSISDQSAAQLLVNPITAWVLLNEELTLAKDDWLLVTAAGSTLGRLVLQLARPRGIRIIAVVRRRAQAQELRELGADAVICTEDESLGSRVAAITARRGVRGAIDSIGGALTGDAARCLAPGGTLVVIGVLGGDPIAPVDVADLLFKGAAVRGFWLSNWFRTRPPDAQQRAIIEVMTLMSDGRLTPPVEAEYDLADYQAAIAHAEREGRNGKVLLTG
jgi:NADPH:quinone reductase